MTHQIGLFVIVSRALLNFNRRPVGTCRHRGQDKSAVPGLPASLFFFLDFVFLFKSTWPLRKTNPPSLGCQRSKSHSQQSASSGPTPKKTKKNHSQQSASSGATHVCIYIRSNTYMRNIYNIHAQHCGHRCDRAQTSIEQVMLSTYVRRQFYYILFYFFFLF